MAESEMDKRDNHAALEKQLVQRRNDVREMLRMHQLYSPPRDQGVGDDADIAADTEQDDVEIHSSAEGLHELQLIADALQRIRNGTYGMCEECGKPIRRERLKALPYVTLCIACKQSTENL